MDIERLESLQRLIVTSIPPGTVRDSAETVLDLIAAIERFSGGLEETKFRAAWDAAADVALSELGSALRADTDVAILVWAMNAAELLREPVAQATDDPELNSKLRAILQNQVEHLDRAIRVARWELDAQSIRSQTDTLLEEVTDAAEKAKDAAGISGGATLSSHFANYARAEVISANVFRGLAVLGIVSAVGIALALGKPEPDDWAGLGFRIAVLAGLGILSAYFARQAGQHRRIFNWARGMEVQLKSFPAFIDQFPADQQAEINVALARRVLGAPPEKGRDAADDTLPVTQVIDLATALAKRSP